MKYKDAIFAGGCFWCMEKPFYELEGVKSVKVGYTGGFKENPTYEEVCSKTTGHVEAVKVNYDKDKTSYKDLLKIFFRNIDPTDDGGQFGDRGETYHTVIFYNNEEEKEISEKYINELDSKGYYNKKIAVRLRPSEKFYEAEDYHQSYYKKNPLRYNLYFKGSKRKEFIEENNYNVPYTKNELKEMLTDLEYSVTQENATEKPFTNRYNDKFELGIYVDIVSKKPLFLSTDKFESGCGWPAFSKPIKEGVLYNKEDRTHGMYRNEVRSTEANSHLGHVFEDGPKELGGLRYCINSAALKFIPIEKMDEEGYGRYKELLEK